MTENERIELANLLFPNLEHDRDYYEKKYPERNLPEGAMVTRYGPSPTGSVHLGNLLSAFADMVYARQTNGSFYLRIEDTDQKRMIDGGIENITGVLHDFDILPNEGYSFGGDYGSYRQSERTEIYQTYIKDLIVKGYAYPCFMTEEEQNNIKEEQAINKVKIGICGVYAVDRDLSLDEVKEKLANGEEYVIRLKSPGNAKNEVETIDCIKGKIKFPEHDVDTVLLKKDGTPTYHFAHAIDDHLMGTTHVIRGDEWLSSVPLHLQLFYELGFKAPKFAHIAPIMKNDNGNKRKLSKRKDPEAAVSYYEEEGIPEEAVKEYLLNIANSNFENWRRANKDRDISEFELKLNKMGVSGALFDMVKLLDVAKTVISKFSAEKVYEKSLKWANKYDKELEKMLENKEYSLKVFGIERGNKKPRKDISKWSEVKENIEYMYDEKFAEKDQEYPYQVINDKESIEKILSLYIEKYYEEKDDKQQWFDKIKELAGEMGYAKEVKEFKENPDKYKAHVGDVSTVLRIALTGRTNTPDMYEIMQVLGKESIIKRFEKAKEQL